jgi:hypothetical protein
MLLDGVLEKSGCPPQETPKLQEMPVKPQVAPVSGPHSQPAQLAGPPGVSKNLSGAEPSGQGAGASFG